ASHARVTGLETVLGNQEIRQWCVTPSDQVETPPLEDAEIDLSDADRRGAFVPYRPLEKKEGDVMAVHPIAHESRRVSAERDARGPFERDRRRARHCDAAGEGQRALQPRVHGPDVVAR